MRSVGDLMSTDPTVLSPQQTLLEATLTLERKQQSGAPVVDEQGRAIGMFTLAVLNSAVLRESKSAFQQPVSRLMTPVVLSLRPDSQVSDALNLLVEARIHRLVVTDDEQKPLGMLTGMDLLRAILANREEGSSGFDILGHELRPVLATLLRRPLSACMTRPVHTLRPTQTLEYFVQLCEQRWFSAAPVLDSENNRMIGLLSQTDVALRLRYNDDDLANSKVSQCMTPFGFVLSPNDRLEAALELMVRQGIHRVVMTDGRHRPCGILTALDLLRLVLLRATGRNAA